MTSYKAGGHKNRNTVQKVPVVPVVQTVNDWNSFNLNIA
jgi:hypothetical protein